MESLQLELREVKQSVDALRIVTSELATNMSQLSTHVKETRVDLESIEEDVSLIDDTRYDLRKLTEDVDVIREKYLQVDTLTSEEVSDLKKINEWFTRRLNKDRVAKRTVRKEKFKQVSEKVELLSVAVARIQRRVAALEPQQLTEQEKTLENNNNNI